MRFYVEDLQIDSSYASSESLEKNIRQQLLSNSNNNEANYSGYHELIAAMKKEYQTLVGEDEMEQSWELSQSIEVRLNQQGLFSLQSSHYSYTGGAHGNSYVGNQLYRLKDETLLSIDSLLISAKKKEFLGFCESEFRKQQNIGVNESLEAKGFWFENELFFLPENFCYSPEGLSFFYNSYEIAPYAFGIIELKLNHEQIKSFLKEAYLISKNSQPSA